LIVEAILNFGIDIEDTDILQRSVRELLEKYAYPNPLIKDKKILKIN